MNQRIDPDGFAQLLELFNIPTKREVERHCRKMEITSDDLFHMIIAGRDTTALAPYRYANHFAELRRPHLYPNEHDSAALQANGVGPLSPAAAKSVRKMFQLFEERRAFAAHFFFTPSHNHWHLLYFDQRDLETANNHWRPGGSHIHYSRESFTREPLIEVWQRVCSDPPTLPSSVHIRYRQLGGEKS
jgi:hypothetical protein